jgi:alkanesulfonate monooxygenase SsuD/methylene tetrahydromethanopterin reductase-like flavin-dependent oxidoreductase (luciferase family)
VFTAQQTLRDAQEFYTDLKGRLPRYGRQPDELKILPGISPVIGGTEGQARRLEKELEELIVPAYGLRQLSTMLGVDLTGHPLDGPLPDVETDPDGQQSRAKLIKDLAGRGGLTIRQVIAKLAGGRGHRVVVGTPEQIADQLQEWYENGAADGFNVMPPHLPGGLTDFVEQVVPELQVRGLFRKEYEERTLRERYGLGLAVAS